MGETRLADVDLCIYDPVLLSSKLSTTVGGGGGGGHSALRGDSLP